MKNVVVSSNIRNMCWVWVFLEQSFIPNSNKGPSRDNRDCDLDAIVEQNPDANKFVKYNVPKLIKNE